MSKIKKAYRKMKLLQKKVRLLENKLVEKQDELKHQVKIYEKYWWGSIYKMCAKIIMEHLNEKKD